MARPCLTAISAVVPLLVLGLLPGGEPGPSPPAPDVVEARVALRTPVGPPDASAGEDDAAPVAAGVADETAGSLELPSERICSDAGYLCAEVRKFGSLRVLRFPSARRELRVRVPSPSHELPEFADALRRAAVRGIMAWDGHPFPIRLVDADAKEAVDLTVRWEAQLSDGGLGETRSRFSMKDGIPRYEVARMALATRSPYLEERALDPGSVELTAAHEMGHALGLPHSDDRGDLMYPTDAATRISERDFVSVHALYTLPNGATIVR